MGQFRYCCQQDSTIKWLVLALLSVGGCTFISPECKIARQKLAGIKVNPPKYSGTDIADGTALIYAEVKVKKMVLRGRIMIQKIVFAWNPSCFSRFWDWDAAHCGTSG